MADGPRAEVRNEEELELFEKKGVLVHRYSRILQELETSKSQVNSTAGNILEILRFAKKGYPNQTK